MSRDRSFRVGLAPLDPTYSYGHGSVTAIQFFASTTHTRTLSSSGPKYGSEFMTLWNSKVV